MGLRPLRRAAISAALLSLLGAAATAQGTLTGKFVLPTLGPVANGTLLLQLSQQATSGGGYYLAPAQVSCYTSTDGSVVGAPNPTATPTGAAYAGTGSLPGGTYYVKIAYTGASSSFTLPSPEASFVLSAPGQIVVSAPTLQPTAATGYSVYIGTSPGTETLQGAVTGWASYTQSTALTSGSALPGANSTACSLLFNDAILPTGTYYTATLSDAAGDTLPGFPRGWYLQGLSQDVGTLTPLATNPAVLFPMPVLQNPANPAIAQSVNSGLALNGYSITGSGNVGPGFYGFYAAALPSVGDTLATWTPNTAIGITRIDVSAATAGSGGTAGATVTVSDGTTTCTFAGLLPAAATSTSEAASGAPSSCVFRAGIALAVKLSADDHSAAPSDVNFGFELVSH